MRIQAADYFDLEEMQTNLLTIGCYIFHDRDLENICQDVKWIQVQPNFFCGEGDHVLDILQHKVQHYTQNFYKLDFISGNIGQGIDTYTDQWHDDAQENMDIQFLCYQSTLSNDDGGALEMQCFDGVTRSYLPCMGDVVVMNHRNLLVHRVNPLKNQCQRIVCNVSYRYA